MSFSFVKFKCEIIEFRLQIFYLDRHLMILAGLSSDLVMAPLNLFLSLFIDFAHFQVVFLQSVENYGLLWAFEVTFRFNFSYNLLLELKPLCRPRSRFGTWTLRLWRHLVSAHALYTCLISNRGIASPLWGLWRTGVFLFRNLRLFNFKQPFVEISCFLKQLLNLNGALILQLLLVVSLL